MLNRTSPPGTRRAHLLLVAAASLLAVLFTAAQASATVMKYLNLVQLVEKSDVIVRGVVDAPEYYHDDTRDQVMTRWSLKVERAYHGDANPDLPLRFVQWGGVEGGIVHAIPGDAALNPGEEVILFLNEADGVLYLTALSQSKYRVTHDGDKAFVLRDMSSIAFYVEGELPAPIERGKVERDGLASFEAELLSLIPAIKGGQ